MELIVKNLTKKFDNNIILDNINFKLTAGHIYGFVGRNGSGKSVLMKIICNFYTPTEGEILLDGENYIQKNSFPKETRSLIESPHFIPNISGFENLKILASIQNKIGEKEIVYWFKRLNLEKEKDKLYSKYSLGMKQKLGIIQVLMENPKLIILDEQFNGIEEETVKKIKEILIEEKKKNKIIIIASHIKEDIEYLSDVIYKIDDGKLYQVEK